MYYWRCIPADERQVKSDLSINLMKILKTYGTFATAGGGSENGQTIEPSQHLVLICVDLND